MIKIFLYIQMISTYSEIYQCPSVLKIFTYTFRTKKKNNNRKLIFPKKRKEYFKKIYSQGNENNSINNNTSYFMNFILCYF